MKPPKFTLSKIPKGIWALGLVSLFMDTSSELIHSLLPIYMVTTFQASMATVGIIEGTAESVAMLTKVFFGFLSDHLKKRKPLVLLGYTIAFLSKPLFPLANSLITLFNARFIDRFGKGIRGAPRDALIGEIAPQEIRGACYGLRQSLDTVGAILGPLLAAFLMVFFHDNINACLWVAVIPAAISVAILVTSVQEPENPELKLAPQKSRFETIGKEAGPFWRLVLIGAVFTLSRFSEAFLLLNVKEIGVSFAYIPLALLLMNIAYAFSSYPAGHLSDYFSRKIILGIGIALLFFAEITLGLMRTVAGAAIGTVLWGLSMGFTQGLFAAMIVDTTSPAIRGTAFGIFNFALGITMLFSSLLAGVVWDLFGAKAAFLTGAGFSGLSLLLLFFWNKK